MPKPVIPTKLTPNDIRDCTTDALDYILNTRELYEGLCVAVTLLEAHARHFHRSVDCEVRLHWQYTGWLEQVRKMLVAARSDFRKNFPSEVSACEWLTDVGYGPRDDNYGVTARDVMQAALVYRDRINTLSQQAMHKRNAWGRAS
jgi:hypothetical protein